MSKGAPNVRYAEIDRETSHTKIHLVLDLDGGTRRDVATGIPTFDALLAEMAKCAALDLGVTVECDTSTDDHHILEDVGAAFGRAIKFALEDSDPVQGTGSCTLPSSDALVLCAVDTDGRSYLGWDLPFRRDWIGAMATENIQGFFRAVSHFGELSLHIKKLSGDVDVHLSEAAFRAFGKCLHTATRRSERRAN